MTDGRIEDPDFDLWEDEDPVVREAVDQAVAPWVGKVTAEDLACMRAAVADMLVLHPTTALLIRSLKERAAPQKSGEEPMDGVAETPARAGGAKKATGSGT